MTTQVGAPPVGGRWPQPHVLERQVDELYRYAPTATGFSYVGALLVLGVLVQTGDTGRGTAWFLWATIVAAMRVFVIVAHGRSLFPDHLAGRGVTTVNLAQVLGLTLLPILTGAIIDHLSGGAGPAPENAYRAAFGAIGLCLSAGLLVYLHAKDAPPRHGRR